MDKRQLRHSLDEFHAELEKTNSIDQSERELLEHLEKDIRDLLGRDEDRLTQKDATLIERLNQAVYQFEVSHPTLTLAIGHVLGILSQEGI